MGFGDEVMVTGHVRQMYAHEPKKVRIDYGKSLWTFRQTEVFANNSKIAAPGEPYGQVYRARENGLRPYHTEKSKTRWKYNPHYRPLVGEFFFTEAERAAAHDLAGCVVINSHVKAGASPNKYWGAKPWMEFIRIARMAGHRLVDICPYEQGSFIADVVRVDTFRQACAALATAAGYVGHESGMHHAAAALGVPGVVIFGGFTPVELTGYEIHRNLGVTYENACGWRTPCEHCAREMAKIEPEQVLKELEASLADCSA